MNRCDRRLACARWRLPCVMGALPPEQAVGARLRATWVQTARHQGPLRATGVHCAPPGSKLRAAARPPGSKLRAVGVQNDPR